MNDNKIERYKLDNGLTVLIENITQFQSVSIGLFLKRGSRDEKINEAGYSHFCEHMIFKGTSRKSKKDIAYIFDEMGGYLNAYTNHELICLYNRVPGYRIMEALDIMFEMFTDSVFNENEIELERQVILSEINSTFEDPQDMVHEDFMSNLFPDQALGYPIIGNKESISSVTRNALYEYYENNFYSDDLVVVLCGNVNSKLIIDYLEKLNFRRKTPNKNIKSIQCDKSVFFTKMPSEQMHLILGNSKFSLDEKLFFQCSVFNLLLGESMSSILFQKIREDLGLCYSIFSNISFYREECVFEIYTSVIPSNSGRIIDALNNVISELKKNGISEIEIRKARIQKIGEIFLNSDIIQKRMNRIAMIEIRFGKIYDENYIINIIENTKIDDLNKLIGILFKKENFITQGLYKNNIILKGLDF